MQKYKKIGRTICTKKPRKPTECGINLVEDEKSIIYSSCGMYPYPPHILIQFLLAFPQFCCNSTVHQSWTHSQFYPLTVFLVSSQLSTETMPVFALTCRRETILVSSVLSSFDTFLLWLTVCPCEHWWISAGPYCCCQKDWHNILSLSISM